MPQWSVRRVHSELHRDKGDEQQSCLMLRRMIQIDSKHLNIQDEQQSCLMLRPGQEKYDRGQELSQGRPDCGRLK